MSEAGGDNQSGAGGVTDPMDAVKTGKGQKRIGRHSLRRKITRDMWFFIVVVGGTLVLSGIYWLQVGSRPFSSKLESEISSSGSPESSNSRMPLFSFDQKDAQSDGRSNGVYWELTNDGDAPLTVYRISLNGEFNCPLAYRVSSEIFQDRNRTLPLTLAKGESASFLAWTNAQASAPAYHQKVLFVYMNLNGSNFRYHPQSDSLSRPR